MANLFLFLLYGESKEKERLELDFLTFYFISFLFLSLGRIKIDGKCIPQLGIRSHRHKKKRKEKKRKKKKPFQCMT